MTKFDNPYPIGRAILSIIWRFTVSEKCYHMLLFFNNCIKIRTVTSSDCFKSDFLWTLIS